MTRKKRGLSEEEQALWDQVAQKVKPLKKIEKKTPPIHYPMSQPKPRFNIPAETPPGNLILPSRYLQRVRKVTLEARLDLHGLTRDQARSRLVRFLFTCQNQGYTWVLVITGKGNISTSRGILKDLVPQWLEDPALQAFVSGYTVAKPLHGGGGAFYVRLKRAPAS
jgi:DNA-nicking Smr family endonuclease